MPAYIRGVAIAFFEPVFHGGCNIVDHFLSSKIFPRLTTLVFFSVSITALMVPVVWWLSAPTWLPWPLLGIAFVIACIEVAYPFPYYHALQNADTSVVASLFSLGRIFVPIFAYIVVGEVLAPIQYAGFALISIASLALTFDPRKFRLNHAFVLMAFVSLILAVETILHKYAFTHGASWSSLLIPMIGFEFVIAATVFLASGGYRSFREDFRRVRSVGRLFVINEFFTWAGNMGDSYGISVLPATVGRAIGSTQPIFALLYAYLFKAKRPELFQEQLGAGDIAKKLSCFALTIIGVVLVVAFGSAGA